MLSRLLLSAVAVLAPATGVFAQAPTPPRDPLARASGDDAFVLTYRVRFETGRLEDLPHAGTAGSLLDTAHGFLVADRIDGGGQLTGERTWLGGQGSSATQVTWRLDGVDVTDPLTGGAPMLVPDLSALAALTVGAASLDADTAGPGPVIDLQLRAPGDRWSGLGSLTLAPAGLQAEAPAIVPITRLLSRTDASVVAGGRVGGASAFVAGRGTTSERVERERPLPLPGEARSLMATVLARPRPDHALRASLVLSDASSPFAHRARFADRSLAQDDTGLLAHASWDGLRAGTTWVVTGGVQRFTTRPSAGAAAEGGLVERLLDGVPLLMGRTGDQQRQRLFLQASAAPASGRWLGLDHRLRVGALVARERARLERGPEPAFGELVNGVPARAWDLRTSAAVSTYANTQAHAWISDHASLGDRLALTAGLRVELDRAAVEGAPTSIEWLDLSPRFAARWRPFTRADLAITGGYSWYRHRLPLGMLAHGDPAGLTGTMSRWDDRDGNRWFDEAELTPVARLDLGAAAVAPDIQRPTTGEFRIGADYALGGWRLAVTGLDRRERRLLALVNTGVTPADYAVTVLSDPGVDIAGLQGFRPLPVYDRDPGSFLADAYALVNTPAPDGRYQGVEIAIDRAAGERWFFRFGGTAYRAEGIGTSRGFRPDENDQGLAGEVFLNPNATTYARGRLFYDRAYIIKLLASYAAPWGLRASVVARYQDGQPFTRAVLAQGLNQGTEIIPTYPRGGQRFTYTGTVDARLEWRLTRGARAVGVFLESFNLANMANEVEEDIVTGPAFRTISAVQPPRVVRFGLHLRF